MTADLLSDLMAFAAALWAYEPVLVNIDSAKTFVAPPPMALGVSVVVPLLVETNAALVDIFSMKLPQMFAEMIQAMKRLLMPLAAGIVAEERLLLFLGRMDLFVVSLKIRTATEWFGIATLGEANDRSVAFVLTRLVIRRWAMILSVKLRQVQFESSISSPPTWSSSVR